VSFLNSLFLLGLAAAVLPILIHLLSRQRAKRLPFGSIDFIRRLEEKRRRRFRLTQLLLLALRVLLLLLIALAFARPTLRDSLFGLGSGGATAAVIILDGSASMGAEVGGESRFEAARRRAESVVELLKDDDETALLVASALPPGAEPGLTRSRDHLRDELNRAAPTDGASELSSALQTAARLLSEARATNRELYIVSDFQTNLIPESARTALKSALPANTRTYVLPVEPARGGNAAVTRVEWMEERVGSSAVRVEAEVARFGGDGALEMVATLSVDGEERERRLVTLEPDEKQTVAYTLTLPSRGDHRGTVTIDAPDLAADNTRPFVMSLADGIRVLVLDGRGESERASGYHVARALAPVDGAESFFRVTHAYAARGGVPELTPFGAVVLAEVGRIADDELARLAEFNTRGGGILIFPGRNLDANFYNKDLLPRLGLPVQLDAAPTEFAGSFARIDDVAAGHPIFAPFGDHQDRLLRDTKFQRYFGARLSPGARPIAHFGGGAVAAAEGERAGAGRVLLATFSADPQWTSLPRDPAFLPFLHEAVKHLARAETAQSMNVLVGRPYRRLLRDLPDATDIVVVRPDGATERVAPREDAAGLVAEVRETDRAGFYALRTASAEFPFAAGIDPAESDLAPLARDEIAESLPGAEIVSPEAEVRRAILAARFGREYWRELLIAALIVALIEAFLARGRFPIAESQSSERRAA